VGRAWKSTPARISVQKCVLWSATATPWLYKNAFGVLVMLSYNWEQALQYFSCPQAIAPAAVGATRCPVNE